MRKGESLCVQAADGDCPAGFREATNVSGLSAFQDDLLFVGRKPGPGFQNQRVGQPTVSFKCPSVQFVLYRWGVIQAAVQLIGIGIQPQNLRLPRGYCLFLRFRLQKQGTSRDQNHKGCFCVSLEPTTHPQAPGPPSVRVGNLCLSY
jgi:hypothetical protein